MKQITCRPGFAAKTLARLASLALLGLALTAQAESWLDISLVPGSSFLQLDKDSVAQTSDNTFTATWRVGIALNQAYFVKHGTVDCRQESLQLETSTYVDPHPLMGRPELIEIVTNYATGKSISGGQASPLSEAERAKSAEFPSGASAEGKLLQRVCQQHYLSQGRREASAAAVQKELGCSSAAMVGSPLCAKDATTLETLHSLFLRLEQIEQACSISRAQINLLLHSWLADVAECVRTVQGCGISLIQLDISGLGGDLGRVARKQSCAYVPRAIQDAAENEERRASRARFQACIKRTIPALDDRVSSADVVASGVFGACRGELTPNLAQSEVFANGVLPGLTAEVLELRRQARQSSSKPKPKQPQT